MLKDWPKYVALAALMTSPLAIAEEELGERLVNDFVTNVITLQGKFEQSLLSAEGEVTDRSFGTLEIERPNRFRWETTEDYETQLVADGLNIWSYDLDLEQVTVKPQAEALANTPACCLADRRMHWSSSITVAQRSKPRRRGFVSIQRTRKAVSLVLSSALSTSSCVAWCSLITSNRQRWSH